MRKLKVHLDEQNLGPCTKITREKNSSIAKQELLFDGFGLTAGELQNPSLH